MKTRASSRLIKHAAIEPTQAPPQNEFANRETRLPVILDIDVSSSMEVALRQLRDALAEFDIQGKRDEFLASKIDIATLLFNDVTTVQPFQNFTKWTPPRLITGPCTSMGANLLTLGREYQKRTDQYLANGISFYPFVVVFLTDGEPTDSPELMERACKWIQEMEDKKKLHFFPFAVDSADLKGVLSHISKKHPVKNINGLKFGELFDWLLHSARSVSQTSPDEEGDIPAYEPGLDDDGDASKRDEDKPDEEND